MQSSLIETKEPTRIEWLNSYSEQENDSFSLLAMAVTQPEAPIFAVNIFEKFQPLYTRETAQKLLAYHQLVALKYNITDSYFKFTKSDQNSIQKPLVSNCSGEIRMKGGSMNCFTAEELAVVIHEQMRVYIEKQTMGNFPVDDVLALEKLVAIMISGFDAQTYHMVAQHWNGHDFPTPAAGVRATIGCSEKTIVEEQGDPTSNLSTLASVQIIDPNSIDPLLASNFVRQTACLGRFFKSMLAEELLQLDTNSSLGGTTLNYMGVMLAQINTELIQQKLPPLLWAIFDTHSEGVFALTKRSFKAIKVADGTNVEPTKAVSDTVLVSHYGSTDPNQDQGYRGRIIWGCMSIENFAAGGNRKISGLNYREE